MDEKTFARAANEHAAMSEFLEYETKRLIPHIFLPLLITNQGSDFDDLEADLLRRFTNSLYTFKNVSSFLDTDILTEACQTFDVWSDLQSQAVIDPKAISKYLKELDVGNTFALYLRKQNTGLMITSPKKIQDSEMSDDSFFLSTFPASQKTKAITNALRELIGVFPTTSVTIPKCEILSSICFAKHLSLLTAETVLDAVHKATKGSSSTVEVREIPETAYATKWLTGVLMDDRSLATTVTEVPRVIKKVRDSIFSSPTDSPLPFRRSGLWFTVKVVLQVMIVKEFGEVNGLFLYKMIMHHFLVGFVRIISKTEVERANSAHIGLFVEMMGKVARRVRKLDLYLKTHNVETSFQETFQDLLDNSARILKKLGNHLKQSYWNPLIEKDRKKCKFELRQPQLWLNHTLTYQDGSLRSYLDSKKRQFEQICKQIQPVKIAQIRHPDHKKLLGVSELSPSVLENHSKESIGGILYDFEKTVDNWPMRLRIEHSSYVWTMFQQYVDAAIPFYNRDPVGYSRFVLTCFKIIQIWDKICCTSFPMLLQHSPGIKMNIAEELLLPNIQDMVQLTKLEEYFRVRSEIAKFPGLLEEARVSTCSFAARFVNTLPPLLGIRDSLIAWGQKQEKLKLQEVEAARERCEKLLATVSNMECEYEIIRWKRTHLRTCTKCQRLKEYHNQQVSIFESPLPCAPEDQNAVIFELNIPPSIGCLRDLLFIFGSKVIGTIQLQDGVDTLLYGPWTSLNVLKNYSKTRGSWLINLISTTKLFLDSHYRTQHPKNPDSDFVKPTGFNCYYGTCNESIVVAKSSLSLLTHVLTSERSESFKRAFKLKVVKQTPYANLQWALDGGKSTPNEVLTRQNECHGDLSLTEFIEYGSLRCYAGLQLRNLYRAMTGMTLSLKTESVFNLICQSLWETSPLVRLGGNTNPILREAHQDLGNMAFVSQFLELLESLQRVHSSNWKDHYILLTVVLSAHRILSFYNHTEATSAEADSILGSVADLLHRCRVTSTNWSIDVERLLSSMVDAPRKEIDALRLKMVEINICTALTYSLGSPELIEGILRSSENITNWLLAVARIYDNLVLLVSGENVTRENLLEKKPTLRNFLRRVQETGIEMEEKLGNNFNRDTLALDKFVLVHYPSVEPMYKTSSSINWHPLVETSHLNVYFGVMCPPKEDPDTYYNTVTFQMDIVGGCFLVNGCPVSYLPSYMETHPDYQRVFPTKSFEVQPYVATYQVMVDL